MQDWTVVRALYEDCGRTNVVTRLLFSNPLSASGVSLLLFAVAVILLLGAVPWRLSGVPAAAVLAGLVLVLAWIGSRLLERRLVAVYPEHVRTRRPLIATYRRRFLGLRYLEFLDRLRLSGLYDPRALQGAVRCCEAELALAEAREMRSSPGWAILAGLLAAGLLAGAPWLAQWDPRWTPAMEALGVALAFVATCLGVMRFAQPRIRHHRELYCMLVWAMEEARAEAPGSLSP